MPKSPSSPHCKSWSVARGQAIKTTVVLSSLLQVIAVMYQMCWFTIYKWLWCRIWECITEEVESDKSNKTYFLDIKAMQSYACHLLLSEWHHRTRRAQYFHQIYDLIKHFSKKTWKKLMSLSSTSAGAQIKKLIRPNFLDGIPLALYICKFGRLK